MPRLDLTALPLPIVQAPMAGAHGAELVGAISNAGGLGSLPLGWTEPGAIAAAVAEVRALTDQPFALNLFVDTSSGVDDDTLARANERLRAYRQELGLEQPPPLRKHIDFGAQFDAAIAERPAAISFTFGIPPARMLEAARAADILTIATAKTVAEARALEAAGVDAICAQGYEAGGHHGPFLEPSIDSQIGTLALVPQVVDAVRVPVLAAGGVTDGRALAAVLALGATCAQVGTAFLVSDEATTSPANRAALQRDGAHTTLTQTFSGRDARGVRNRFIDEMTGAEDIAPYPYQHWLTRDIRSAATAQGRSEFVSLWAGQSVPLARAGSARDILLALLEDARAVLHRTQARAKHFQITTPEPSPPMTAQIEPPPPPPPTDHTHALALIEPVHSHALALEAPPVLEAPPPTAVIPSEESEPSVIPSEATAEEEHTPGTPRTLGIDPAVAERKRKAAEAWERMVAAKDSGAIVEGFVTAAVKGGLLVQVDGIRGFLPASQTQVPVDGTIESLVKTRVPLRVLDTDVARKRIVVSHKRASESQKRAARSTFLRALAVGQRYDVTVVRLAPFGAFVDIGQGVEGLVPMSELAFERIEKVEDLLKVGDTFPASILRIEQNGKKIGLSRKNALPDPWRDAGPGLRPGATVEGKVVAKEPRLQVEIAPDVVGTVRESDANPADYEIGETLEVTIRTMDRKTRRIMLSTAHAASAAAAATQTGFATLGEELAARLK